MDKIRIWQICLLMSLLASSLSAVAYFEGDNIALGKKYTFSAAPNYPLCTDLDDVVQLTDGEYVDFRQFWADKRCVGWIYQKSITITIDLEKIEPIKGVSFNTAAGTANVSWPKNIFIFVSDDGKNFSYAGELINLSDGSLPPPYGYKVHRYKNCSLVTKGRYVRLVVIPAGSYCFVDEIEIFRGPQEYLGKNPGIRVNNIEEFIKDNLVHNGIIGRIRQDISDLTRQISESNLHAQQIEDFLEELKSIEREAKNIPKQNAPNFRAIMPLNTLHKEVYRVGRDYARLIGYDGLIVWKNNRWDMLSPISLPDAEDVNNIPKLEMVMMKNEYRSEAFNITNLTDQDLNVKLAIAGLPGGINPAYISVHQVEFVDTRDKILIADALPLAERTSDGFEIYVPVGMTRQVWLTFNPTDIDSGVYNGKISVTPGNNLQKIDIPIVFRLSSLVFPEQPSISLGVWDYTDRLTRDLTEGVREHAIGDMREHFVDSPWATSSTAPWPTSIQIVNDEIHMEMDFSRFDNWISDWQGARNYFFYLSVGTSFGPNRVHMSDPLFNKLVSAWTAKWAQHVREIGLDPSQIYILLVDEPQTEEQAQRIITWAKAIKAGAPEFVIWEDPVYPDPWNANQEMFEVCDVLCPNVPIYYREGERSRDFYESWRLQGKKLWVYQCSGGRIWDPYYYHRLQHWFAWEIGAVGSGFWSYADGGGTTAWNEYLAMGGVSYTPVYFGETTVTTGKHWEAVREGIEDYEYLKMLSDMIESLEKQEYAGEVLDRAKALLLEAPRRVCGEFDGTLNWWWRPKERDAADIERIKILNMLEELSSTAN